MPALEIIFVHGAFARDGAWWWQPAATLIEQAVGVPSRAVVLPSCAETTERPSPDIGLLEDAAALGDLLDDVEAALVVAHSYGGTVAAQGATHPAVRQLVYISSFLPEIGQSHASLIPPSPDPVPVRDNGDGTLSVLDDDRAYFDRRFLHDVADPARVAQAHMRLCAQNAAALGAPTSAAAWQTIPSTYLVCADDRSTDPALQRFHAARATTTVELPVAHHPFLSRPELVAEQLAAIVAGTR